MTYFHLAVHPRQIAPRDKRFASAVLATIAALVPKDDATQPYNVGPRLTRRLEALAQIGVIEAAPALPALRQLKLSPNDAIRKAAIKAVEKIE